MIKACNVIFCSTFVLNAYLLFLSSDLALISFLARLCFFVFGCCRHHLSFFTFLRFSLQRKEYRLEGSNLLVYFLLLFLFFSVSRCVLFNFNLVKLNFYSVIAFNLNKMERYPETLQNSIVIKIKKSM